MTASTATVPVWGRDLTADEINDAIAAVNDAIDSYGLSDDRVTYRNALEDGLRKFALTRPAAPTAAVCTGPMVKNLATDTTHFTNSFGETFCGTLLEWANEIKMGSGRASCRRCQQASDAAERDDRHRTGSPARR